VDEREEWNRGKVRAFNVHIELILHQCRLKELHWQMKVYKNKYI